MAKKKEDEKPTNFEEIIKSVSQKYSVWYDSDLDRAKIQRLRTGVFQFDYAIGGGIPLRKVITLWGAPSSGKTSMCMRIVASAQRQGFECLWIDTENTFDIDWAGKLGVDVGKLKIIYTQSAQGALNFLVEISKSEMFDLIIVDSVAMLLPEEEANKLVGEWTQGLLARLLHQFARKYTNEVLANKDIGRIPTLIFTNQERERIVQFGNPITKPGGNALNFLATLEVRFSKPKQIENKDKEVVALEFPFSVTKNRYYKYGVEGFYRMVVNPILGKEVGEIWDEPQVVEMMKESGFLYKEGAVYKLFEIVDVAFPNLDSVKEYFYSHKDFYEIVKNKFLNYLLDGDRKEV